VLRAANQSDIPIKKLTTESLLLTIGQTSFELRLTHFSKLPPLKDNKPQLHRYLLELLKKIFFFFLALIQITNKVSK
jgi:hypothetical protein